MNRRKFYQRISGLIDPQQLCSKKIAIVGLGSGGSRVAAELGRMGVQLLLVERPHEKLEEHNIVRHLLGYSSLGRSKLTETAHYLAEVNPGLYPCCHALDVVEQPASFTRLLTEQRPDVIAVCTDNEASKHVINEVALRLGIPQIGAGVYDGGIGGEIYIVVPGRACYGCIADHLQLERYSPPRPPGAGYDGNEPPTPAVSALNLDIEQIALLQSRFLLELLFAGQSTFLGFNIEFNLCVFANRLVPGTFERPLHADFFSIPRRENCLECGGAPKDVDEEAEKILTRLAG
ncbi:MAG TPA: ThiF family adenylyltransferase [Candidatus Limnocylindrales bacterium]|nr:ThiF family adenylyltransferase [Candidatus Limnocylindrales bacterium]